MGRRASYPPLGIRCHLQRRHSRGQHHQCAQEQWIRRHTGGGYEQERANPHRQQSQHHSHFVADPIHYLGPRKREDEIRRKEGELNQHDLGVT